MKNKSILFILLFIFTYTKAVGQTFVYTYNAQHHLNMIRIPAC